MAQKFLFADVDEFVDNVVNISETLSNLTFLIEVDAEHPELVRRYARQAEDVLRALGELVRSADAGVCESSCS